MSIKLYVNYLVSKSFEGLVGDYGATPEFGNLLEDGIEKLSDKVKSIFDKEHLSPQQVKLIYLSQVTRYLQSKALDQSDDELQVTCKNIWNKYALFSKDIRAKYFNNASKDEIDNKIDALSGALDFYYEFSKEHDPGIVSEVHPSGCFLNVDFKIDNIQGSALMIIKKHMLEYILDNILSYSHENTLSETVINEAGYLFRRVASSAMSWIIDDVQAPSRPEKISIDKFEHAVSTIDDLLKAFNHESLLLPSGLEDSDNVKTMNTLVDVLSKKYVQAQGLAGLSFIDQRLTRKFNSAIADIGKILQYRLINSRMLEEHYRDSTLLKVSDDRDLQPVLDQVSSPPVYAPAAQTFDSSRSESPLTDLSSSVLVVTDPSPDVPMTSESSSRESLVSEPSPSVPVAPALNQPEEFPEIQSSPSDKPAPKSSSGQSKKSKKKKK